MKWLVLASVLLLALAIYGEISDPCVRWKNRGWIITSYGDPAMVQPQQVCVERRSGWHQ